jgi:hypothetical protein
MRRPDGGCVVVHQLDSDLSELHISLEDHEHESNVEDRDVGREERRSVEEIRKPEPPRNPEREEEARPAQTNLIPHPSVRQKDPKADVSDEPHGCLGGV